MSWRRDGLEKNNIFRKEWWKSDDDKMNEIDNT